MNIVQVEENLKKITTKFSKDTFVFDLMTAYDFPKSTISKLKLKNKKHDDVVVPSKLHFVGVSKKELASKFEELVKEYSNAKKAPRFVVVTDYQDLKAYDTKVGEKLDTEIKNLSKHPDFFLPWLGIEKKVFQGENPADVKAAEKLAKFFDLILKDNLKLVEKNRHALNVFLTRILFCFFAEDTDIFKKGLFTESLASHTKTDGGDIDEYLQRLFEVLNKKSRTGLPDFLKEFPYVNGGLFAEEFPIPKFSKKSRESLIDLGSDLNWAEINPDIFGSMIQAVVHPDQRAGLGMHYTSVTNILKVIEPLFLTELKEEFSSTNVNKNKLKKLLERIGNIKIFDPACGSGNFLIIAYKELRLLEMDILKALGEIPMSGISLSNFYGIEIDDFAHEVAKLSLWLAEHQMDVLFNKQFGDVKASLPLKDSGKIVCGNATQEDWKKVCNVTNEEVYIIGNPPYLGSKYQEDTHRNDMKLLFGGMANETLDYISCWFYKGASFIRGKNAKLAFVSTNSICQGEQVANLWPLILKNNIEIGFCHHSFKWSNNAKGKAAVICVIVGLRNQDNTSKKIFMEGKEVLSSNINAYLTDGPNVYVERTSSNLFGLPKMGIGNKPIDDGNFLFTSEMRDQFIKKEPGSKKFFYRWYGADEFLKGNIRYCLLPQRMSDNDLKELIEVTKLIKKVKVFRESSTSAPTRALALKPKNFHVECFPDNNYIVIPKVSSERRYYIPVGYFSPSMIASDLLNVVKSASTDVFALLSSKMHMVWVKAVSGRLKSDYRYSSEISYNTFPSPVISAESSKLISQLVFNIIGTREKHHDLPVGKLYNPESMPKELENAHKELDTAIESCYRAKPFSSDSERLTFLLNLYIKRVGTK